MAGLRVVRGPDWKWGNQDGGKGHMGTVESGNDGTVCVIWDNGDKKIHRNGAGRAADLIVLDNGPAGVAHPGIECDFCEFSIRGIRWKCATCDDYELCTECYGNNKHDRMHKFTRIDMPGQKGVEVTERWLENRTQARGIQTGAVVVRGPGWNSVYGDEDGGNGNDGVVQKVGYLLTDHNQAACVVKWTNDSDSYVYRLGLDGHVDIKYKIPAIGWFYYPNHLPVLRDLNEVCNLKGEDPNIEPDMPNVVPVKSEKEEIVRETRMKFKIGNAVRLNNNKDELTQLQADHGGVSARVLKALGMVGVVRGIGEDGDLEINFGGFESTINPAAVTKLTAGLVKEVKSTVKFKAGDQLILKKDLDLKKLQAGHGGWHEYMQQLINSQQAGTVKEVDCDGDIRVDFGSDVVFLLNPDGCGKASKNIHLIIPSKPRNRRPSSIIQVSPRPPPTPKSGFAGDPFSFTIFQPGDHVRIKDAAQRKTQTGHDEFNTQTKQAIDDVGIVEKVDHDGDVVVKFSSGTLVMNPQSLILVTVPKAKSPDLGPNLESFQEGDQVQIELDIELLISLQTGHGGWNGSMIKATKKTGKVREVLPSGDIRVQYDTNTWTFNPAVFRLVKARSSQSSENPEQVPDCPVCLKDKMSTIFGCGHGACDDCSSKLKDCAICQTVVAIKTKLFI